MKQNREAIFSTKNQVIPSVLYKRGIPLLKIINRS
jgi:hypothetical protein